VSVFGFIAIMLAVAGPVGLPDRLSPLSLLLPVCVAGDFVTHLSYISNIKKGMEGPGENLFLQIDQDMASFSCAAVDASSRGNLYLLGMGFTG
jgi:hypothetical protein